MGSMGRSREVAGVWGRLGLDVGGRGIAHVDLTSQLPGQAGELLKALRGLS